MFPGGTFECEEFDSPGAAVHYGEDTTRTRRVPLPPEAFSSERRIANGADCAALDIA